MLGRNTFKSYVIDSIFGPNFVPEHPAPKLLVWSNESVHQVMKYGMFKLIHMLNVYHAIS